MGLDASFLIVFIAVFADSLYLLRHFKPHTPNSGACCGKQPPFGKFDATSGAEVVHLLPGVGYILPAAARW